MGQPLAMQMSVCHRHPVIMLYLCPMLFRRKPSGGRPVSCSLTAHWLHRPGRLLEARVMKADIASCLWTKAHGFVLQLRQGMGLRGHSVSPKPRFWFWSVAPLSRPVACLSSRKSHFTALSIGSLSRFRACLSSRKSHFTALSIVLYPASRACPSFRWPHFMALSSEPSLSLCGIPPFPPSFCPK